MTLARYLGLPVPETELRTVGHHPCVLVQRYDREIDQVTAKGYDVPHRAKGLPIYAVGLSFDSQTRQLADAQAVAL